MHSYRISQDVGYMVLRYIHGFLFGTIVLETDSHQFCQTLKTAKEKHERKGIAK